MELSVFGLGGDEDGNIGVGVFPEGKEILIRAGRGTTGLSRGGAGVVQKHDIGLGASAHHAEGLGIG